MRISEAHRRYERPLLTATQHDCIWAVRGLAGSNERTCDSYLSSEHNANEKVAEIIPHLAEITDKKPFGDVWKNPDLSKRDRSLLTIIRPIVLDRVSDMRIFVNSVLWP